MAPLFYALLSLVVPQVVLATLLAASTIEACVDTGGSLQQTCAQRLVVTLSVQNGQNATESLQTYTVTSATDSAGQTYELLDTLEFTLVKSVIELHYPLIYQRQFNARPREISLSQSANGRVSSAVML